MIPDIQALEIITERFREVDLEEIKPQGVLKSFDVVADYAICLLESERHQEFESFCSLICDLYGHCGSTIATAVENVFIYRLSAHIGLHTNRKALMALLPEKLRDVMIRQCNSSAI